MTSNYRDGLTPEQIKSLYTPTESVIALRKRLADMRASNPAATMTDALSAFASDKAGEPLRYVAGKLVRS